MREKPSAHDDVVRIVELEQEGFAGLQGPKEPVAAGLPEVHLVQVGTIPEEAVPVPVRDGDITPHGRDSSRDKV